MACGRGVTSSTCRDRHFKLQVEGGLVGVTNAACTAVPACDRSINQLLPPPLALHALRHPASRSFQTLPLTHTCSVPDTHGSTCSRSTSQYPCRPRCLKLVRPCSTAAGGHGEEEYHGWARGHSSSCICWAPTRRRVAGPDSAMQATS